MTSLALEKEARVRAALSRELGVTLTKRSVKLMGEVTHEFDFVSENADIVGEVKSSEPNKQRGKSSNLRSAQLGDFCRDCILLLASSAKKRLFVLTNKTVYDKFLQTEYGKVAKAMGIEILNLNV